MSNIANLAADRYRASAQLAFQSGSRLRSRVTEISGVRGKRQDFPVFGTGDSTQRDSQAEITPANLSTSQPWATLHPIEWFDLIDRQDAALTEVDAAGPAGTVAGRACGRKIDNHIIEALKNYDSDAYSRAGLTAGLSHTTTNTGEITADDLATVAAMIMDETDDEDVELTLVAPALQFAVWAKDEKLANMDYLQQGKGTGNVTVTGRFGQIYSMMPILIGQKARRDDHGKLPDNRAYVFDKKCVGLAIGTLENMGIIDFVAMRRSVLVGAETKAGATRINNSGIIEVIIKT